MVDEPVEDELLQRYFDGELEPTAAAQIAQQLERDAATRDRLRTLTALRGAIGNAIEDETRGVDFNALFARIEQGVHQQPTPTVAEHAWWRERIEQRPAKAMRWMPAMGAFAAAAVVLLAVLRGLSLPHGDDVQGAASGKQSGTQQSGAPAPSTPGSEVVQVDFGSSGGTVFEIALDDGNSTPVVWINDGPEQAVQ